MKFKTAKLELEFIRLDKRLQIVGYALDGFCIGNFGIEIFITCIYRDDSPTHGNYCAFDFRIESGGGLILFTVDQQKKLKEFCKYIKYDLDRPSKPTLYIHENRDAPGIHGHAQVYPSKNETVIRNN